MKRIEPVRHGPMDQINITPFVDVCLVILLIFMVVTPLLVPGHAVELPEASNGGSQPEEKSALVLSVDAGGRLYVGGAAVGLEELGGSLGRVHARNPERPVHLMGDRGAPFGEVKAVMQAARDAGFKSIALIVKERAREIRPAGVTAKDGA